MVPRIRYGEPDPRGEVDLLLAARNPHIGITATSQGHETRLYALRHLRTLSTGGNGTYVLRVLLIVLLSSVAAVFVFAMLANGPRDGAAAALSFLARLAIGGVFLALILGGIVAGFLALMFLISLPGRAVAALRRRRAQA